MKIEKMNFMYNDDITAVNKEQYDEHLKLYDGYINKINEIDGILQTDPQAEDANATYSKYRCLKLGESYALDGVILHELYFENMRGIGLEPNVVTLNTITNDFGSFENWKKLFIATAKASRGWAVLAFDQRSRTLRNIGMDSHDQGNIVLSFPILVLDVYEHAYFMQYGTDKAGYINNFMNNIDWNIVNRRVARL